MADENLFKDGDVIITAGGDVTIGGDRVSTDSDNG